MPTVATLFAFALATTVLVLVPGPGMLFLLARGIGHGRRAAILSALGVESATVVFVLLSAAGLTAVVAASATALLVIRWVGAGYLVHLAIRAFRGAGDLTVQATGGRPSVRRAFLEAFTVGISNPKVALFFLAFVPQFVRTDAGPAGIQVLVLGGVFVTLGLSFDLICATAAGSMGAWLARRPVAVRRQRYVTGTAYLTLAGSAALGVGTHRT